MEVNVDHNSTIVSILLRYKINWCEFSRQFCLTFIDFYIRCIIWCDPINLYILSRVILLIHNIKSFVHTLQSFFIYIFDLCFTLCTKLFHFDKDQETGSCYKLFLSNNTTPCMSRLCKVYDSRWCTGNSWRLIPGVYILHAHPLTILYGVEWTLTKKDFIKPKSILFHFTLF